MKRYFSLILAIAATVSAQIVPSTGNVRGPTSATDNAVARYDGTTGKLVQNSAVTIDDSGNTTAADLILGASGPSVKSSLSARAPRQGLVFDGTAGATVASVPAFGTGDFTATAWVNVRSLGTLGIFGGATNAFGYYVDNTGLLVAQKRGVALILSSTSTIPANKFVLVTYTRSGTTGTHYFNGVAINSGADNTDYSVGITSVGSVVSSTNPFNGGISGALIYNRALSASEVVALYEAGVPSGADYNSASNTSVVTAAWTDSGTYTTFSSASASTFTAVRASGTGYSGLGAALAAPIRVGQRFLVTGTLTLNNGKTVQPSVYLDNTASLQTVPVGAFSITLTATAANGGISFTSTGDADYTISGLSITRLGLLLAPDAQQMGAGTKWYDASGNAANITLPASGVTWANQGGFYQEGTCNLTLESGTGTITSYTVTAYYTKVGRLVTINGYIEITNNGTGGSYLTINGLPFTSAYYASTGAREGGTHGNALSMIVNPSTTSVSMYKYDNSYPVATGSNVPFTLTYITSL